MCGLPDGARLMSSAQPRLAPVQEKAPRESELGCLPAYAARLPLLTATQEQELGRRCRAGDESAQSALVEHNIRLVAAIARGYVGRGLPLADMVQEGLLGLWKAAGKFEPERGLRFSTMATWWIRQAILRAVDDKGMVVRLPAERVGRYVRVRQAEAELSQLLGRLPTIAEATAALGWRMPNVAAQAQLWQDVMAGVFSLEWPLEEEDGAVLGDLLADPNGVMPGDEESLDAYGIDFDRAGLTAKEKAVIERRYGLADDHEQTLDEIGAALGVSRERVRQIERQALDKLRRCYGAARAR